MRRLTPGLHLRTLLILVAILAVVMGSDAARLWWLAHQDQIRDREVLEAALLDLLDPHVPENRDFVRNRRAPRQVVLNLRSYSLGSGSSSPGDLDDEEQERRLTGELGGDWRRRNSGGTASLGGYGPWDRRIVLDDIDRLVGASDGQFDFAGRFWAKYPGSRGYVYAYRPGYSADGRTAVVLFSVGPSPHGMTWLFLMDRTPGGWRVKWRRRHIWR
jgi:hypothetical protein